MVRITFQNNFQTYLNKTPSLDLLGPFDIPKNFNGTVKLKIHTTKILAYCI